MLVATQMRAVLAAALSLFLAFVALAPHVHVDAHGTQECGVCVASGRGAEPVESRAPDVAPRSVVLLPVLLEPGLAPVLGAPLGAVPGQSPPRA
jgi:hypothetical protein